MPKKKKKTQKRAVKKTRRETPPVAKTDPGLDPIAVLAWTGLTATITLILFVLESIKYSLIQF